MLYWFVLSSKLTKRAFMSFVDFISGGSRISNPWFWSENLLFDKVFAENGMKMKEIGPRRKAPLGSANVYGGILWAQSGVYSLESSAVIVLVWGLRSSRWVSRYCSPQARCCPQRRAPTASRKSDPSCTPGSTNRKNMLYLESILVHAA